MLPSQPTRPGVWDIFHVKNVTCSGVSAFQLDKMRDRISLPQMNLIMLNIGSVRRKAFVVLCGRVPREQVPCSPSVWQQHRLLYPRYFLMVVIQRELHSMKSEVMISPCDIAGFGSTVIEPLSWKDFLQDTDNEKVVDTITALKPHVVWVQGHGRGLDAITHLR